MRIFRLWRKILFRKFLILFTPISSKAGNWLNSKTALQFLNAFVKSARPAHIRSGKARTRCILISERAGTQINHLHFYNVYYYSKMNRPGSNYPRDASFTTRARKMSALGFFRRTREYVELPASAEIKQSSLSAEQNLQTKLAVCDCSGN